MAFNFTVEDGTGRSDANSYVSALEADEILSLNHHAAPAWQALTTTDKERLLAWASRLLDERARWAGRKAVESSSLRWPRTYVTDRDGIAVHSNLVPQPVKVVTAELARSLIAEDRTAEREQDGLRSLRADVVELEFAEGHRRATIPAHIWAVLGPLARPSGGVVR